MIISQMRKCTDGVDVEPTLILDAFPAAKLLHPYVVPSSILSKSNQLKFIIELFLRFQI